MTVCSAWAENMGLPTTLTLPPKSNFMTWKKLASISVIIFQMGQAIYEYLLAGYCTQPLFSCLNQNAHANPRVYIYIYINDTPTFYHKDERHMIPCSWAWHDMPIPKPQVFAPNGYKIGFFTLTFGCVFICNLGWYICGCSNVWWFFPVMFSSFFARQKRNCLKLQTWSYNACVSISVYVMIPSLFWWTSSGSPRSSRRRFGCRWC